MAQDIVISQGTTEDIPALLELIRELAEYEKAPDEVEVTSEELMKDGFGTQPSFWFLTAKTPKGRVIGIALYYMKYSTWKGKSMYLEDLVISASYRRKGIGERLFSAVAQEAKRLKVKKLEWQVLEWNVPAIAFYRNYKAQMDSEWVNFKLDYHQLQNLGEE